MTEISVEDFFEVDDRPIPEVLPEWQPFFEGCKNQTLLIEECQDCGQRQFFPRGQCIRCGGSVLQLSCSGQGTIYSVTTTRITHDPCFKKLVPFHIALIDLEEGVRMSGNILGGAPKIGDRVKAKFTKLGTGKDTWAAYWVIA